MAPTGPPPRHHATTPPQRVCKATTTISQSHHLTALPYRLVGHLPPKLNVSEGAAGLSCSRPARCSASMTIPDGMFASSNVTFCRLLARDRAVELPQAPCGLPWV